MPFLLRPTGKDYLWGGRRLRDDFGKQIDLEPLAETWECSTHPSGESYVASGEFEGLSLRELVEKHPEIVGTHPKIVDGQLPILIKFIDAKQDLSVQVHPDDEYARVKENGQNGKTEMWYVVDAEKDAKLVYGLSHDSEKNILKKAIEDETLMCHFQQVPIKKDDVFFIPAGMIHAIGAGSLVAEIQQNSNLTYRLYDYGRKDKNGNKRELHIDKALDVANMKSAASPRQPLRLLKYQKGCASELLCRCEYFQVERLLINTESHRDMAAFHTDVTSFKVLMCLEGCGSLFDERGFALNLFKGDCVFVPANMNKLSIHGRLTLLSVCA